MTSLAQGFLLQVVRHMLNRIYTCQGLQIKCNPVTTLIRIHGHATGIVTGDTSDLFMVGIMSWDGRGRQAGNVMAAASRAGGGRSVCIMAVGALIPGMCTFNCMCNMTLQIHTGVALQA